MLIAAEKQPALTAIITGALVGLLAIGLGMSDLAGAAVGLSAYALTRFVLELGSGIPVDSLILLVAALQWLVAPVLSYAGLAPHAKYRMYVPEQEYLLLAVPGTVCLAVGLSLFRRRRSIRESLYAIAWAEEIARQNHYLPWALVIVGGACSILGSFAPPSLAFLFFLLSNVTYIGIIAALYSRRQERWWMLAGAGVWMLLVSTRYNVFHDLLLWTAFIGLYLAVKVRLSVVKRAVAVMAFGLLVFVIHTVKIEIRQMLLAQAATGSSIELFGTVLDETFFGEERDPLDDRALASLITRLNQGWIVSRVMEQVPARRPFADGETIELAVRAAFLPRILDPGKVGAGGRALFERFTGFRLAAASMGLSLLGEGYGNYGTAGAALFLLAYGAFISLLLRIYWRWSTRHPIGGFWLPLMFLHAVKAETDFVVVLNYLTKGLAVTVVMVLVAERLLGALPVKPVPRVPPAPRLPRTMTRHA